ncbi:MotE family protein [Bombella saccharophila]|uniref:Magnesium transporter MgtE intracellular domain-containing protein n=1 Tax=Bombella saccharophila TaxID=2967338 RepID=A0ABT3W783_9PROT|nr:hypothetical protein [Bombella saccharophila]MCX5614932.1 hypothetical protein [Bombella saccharophila]
MAGACFKQSRWLRYYSGVIALLWCVGVLWVSPVQAEDDGLPSNDAEQQMQEQQRIFAAARKALELRLHVLSQSKAAFSETVDNHKLVPKEAAARLVGIYEVMRPGEAAAVFNVMDPHVLIAIAASMNTRKLSAIMAHMTPDRVNLVSQYLVGVRHFHHPALNIPAVAEGASPPGQEGAVGAESLERVHYEAVPQRGPLLPSRQ